MLCRFCFSNRNFGCFDLVCLIVPSTFVIFPIGITVICNIICLWMGNLYAATAGQNPGVARNYIYIYTGDFLGLFKVVCYLTTGKSTILGNRSGIFCICLETLTQIQDSQGFEHCSYKRSMFLHGGSPQKSCFRIGSLHNWTDPTYPTHYAGELSCLLTGVNHQVGYMGNFIRN